MTRPHEFSRKVKLAAFERAAGRCEKCTARLVPGKFRFDHILPLALDGASTLENCQCICRACDLPKTAEDIGRIRKADRERARHIGAKARTRSPLPGGRDSKWRRKLDGTVVPR